ncbi:MAG: VOC family protein [Bradymonadia bacterium]
MTVPVLTHIALQVNSLDESIEFYRSFCGLDIVHERPSGQSRVVWLGHPATSDEFIFVLMEGGYARPPQHERDYSHLGFALPSKAAVDEIAERAQRAGCLVWAPRQDVYPIGYYCGLKDPDGYFVEFSYGQPLGPGAPKTS